MFDAELLSRARRVLDEARAKDVRIVTAESCTGGLICALLTEVPGSSDVLERGFVTYSNAAKEELLDVSRDALDRHGAVSEPVARAMAEGALRHARAQLSVAVTGIAGPGGGTQAKPVGLVYIAAARTGAGTVVQEHRFGAIGRDHVRRETVAAAVDLLRTRL